MDELNREAAEKILGWTLSAGGNMWLSQDGSAGYFVNESKFGPNFRPSENIAQAFQLVEKMRELGYRFKLESTSQGGYRCSFWSARYSAPPVCNASPATAFTEAAVRAVKGEGEK